MRGNFCFAPQVMHRDGRPPFPAVLVLGRVAYLPTVWSNCLAGWWLAGGGNAWKLCLLLPGLSAFYLAGGFLNDAFDVEFDRQRKAARPIPGGRIPLSTVWRMGWSSLALGALSLLALGKPAFTLGLILGASILIFNATHKFLTASPWLMGMCRFWVYVIAGTTGAEGLNGWPIWCGSVMAVYVVGLSYVAQRENFRAPAAGWPLVLLAVPLLLAQLMNAGGAFPPALVASMILALWLAHALQPLLRRGGLNPGRAASRLHAGIVIVDWLAIAPQCSPGIGGALAALFLATLLLQRLVPAR